MNVLVLYHHQDRQRFLKSPKNRMLAQGLKRAGMTYELATVSVGKPDLAPFKAVLCWWYKPTAIPASRRTCLAFEAEMEARCGRRQIPLVNATKGAGNHGICLERWRETGIPCGAFQYFDTVSDLHLDFPLVLRVNGRGHSSKDSFLAWNREQAAALIQARKKDRRRNLDLAIRFLDTRYPDGLYRKWRTLVVGDTLIADDVMISDFWRVKMNVSFANELSHQANDRFRHTGPCNPDLLRRAARVIGQDIVALDYSIMGDGRYFFWEANRCSTIFDCSDPDKTAAYRRIVGQSHDQCKQFQRTFGQAIADLLHKRANQSVGK